MSSTNLLKTKYALDMRNIRVSRAKKEDFDSNKFSVSETGLIDITDFSTLNQFSAFLQEGKSDSGKIPYSSGNLNLYALNDRIRSRMIEIISKLKEVDICEIFEKTWSTENAEEMSISLDTFASVFFEKNNQSVEIDELIRFWFSYNNPAHEIYHQNFLSDFSILDEINSSFGRLVSQVTDKLPLIDEGNIIDFLLKPQQLYPNSIKSQITYIIEHWAKYLSQENLKFLLLALDLLKEEEKFRGFGGPGPSEVYEFGGSGASFYGDAFDYERFSQDQHWMPRLVLLAKNIYVWLEQLSRKYNREIKTLADIPNEELDLLSSRGITGLWLVGVWERSPASKKIKNSIGNREAIASAYSIYDYTIANALGGENAYNIFKDKLMRRGIRIGADMVPNHMGIYSKWTVEHPDWFIHSKEAPFPSYTYNGENLSDSQGVEIYLEDHYYDQSDAAVTFKRVNSNTGETHYIYHGNDGTSFPWNDTAQIDFLNKDARETIIQTIVNVAKNFPIIRFDAAMVLAKQHIRRLWYPAPGEGGDIPSRSQHSLSDEEFNRRIPNEFWREVVDRVSEEAPDTLLLAEAFWLLEGYFVRTLGMHRVYNSAFMKMLADEENSKYRQTVKNVLEYDPEILKRFVNYLTTPDEAPAVQGFGTGDKYFGLATMMATMPGLPMFGHGQFEGYSEKYGMEFAKPQLDEQINNGVVDRHEMEIVPLLKKRYLFSGSKNFYLYDFFNDDGKVNEDVFAYSNRFDGEKAIIVYNNRYAHANGWIKRSVAYSEKSPDKTTRLRQIDLFEGLDLSNNDGFLLFRDHVTGLEYIRSKDDIREKGLFVEVGAFKYHVFMELKEVSDHQEIWAKVATELRGSGTYNLQELYNNHREPQEEEIVFEEYTEQVVEPEIDNVTVLKVQVTELEDENNALKGQIAAMNAELENSDQISDDKDGMKAENVSLKVKNEELERKIQELTISTVKDKKFEEEVTILQSEVDELQKENKSLLNEKDELLKQLNSQRKEEVVQDNYKVLQKENLKLGEENSKLLSQLKELEKLKEIKGEFSDLKEDYEELNSRLEKVKSEKLDLQNEIASLSEEVIELKAVKETDHSFTSSGETVLSSSLVENILKRVETAKSGIKIRNLAMSLGISASVCLNHVRTMQNQNLVVIKYKSADDQNPTILPKK